MTAITTNPVDIILAAICGSILLLAAVALVVTIVEDIIRRERQARRR